jgi:phage shock protein A
MTKQTILGRVAQLATADISTLLDQAEDPQKMTDQLIREYTDNIKEAEDAVAGTLGNLRLMEQDRAEDVSAAAEWGGKAVAVSRKADELRATGGAAEADRFDNLARIALGRQLRSEKEATAAEPVIASQHKVADRLRAGLDGMKERLRQLQARRDELVVRSRSAHARNTVLDSIKSANVLDPTGDLGRFEDKVRREEARAQGRQELAASSLDAQFVSPDGLGDDTEVASRLARLKSGAA